jgi:hypothetical protein
MEQQIYHVKQWIIKQEKETTPTIGISMASAEVGC